MKKLILITSVTLGMISSASAATVTAESGIYVGGNVGWSIPSTWTDASLAQSLGVSSVSTHKQGLTAGATLGYDYALNQNFLVGGEMGYLYFGKTKYTANTGSTLNVQEQGIQFLLTSTYLNQNGFNVFGKAGIINTRQTASGSTGDTSALSAWSPALAAGVGYMPIQNVNIALQYEHVFGNTNSNATTDSSGTPRAVNTVTVGVTYKFGI